MRKKCFSDLQNNDDGENIYNAYPGLPDTILSTLHVLTSFNLYKLYEAEITVSISQMWKLRH